MNEAYWFATGPSIYLTDEHDLSAAEKLTHGVDVETSSRRLHVLQESLRSKMRCDNASYRRSVDSERGYFATCDLHLAITHNYRYSLSTMAGLHASTPLTALRQLDAAGLKSFQPESLPSETIERWKKLWCLISAAMAVTGCRETGTPVRLRDTPDVEESSLQQCNATLQSFSTPRIVLGATAVESTSAHRAIILKPGKRRLCLQHACLRSARLRLVGLEGKLCCRTVPTTCSHITNRNESVTKPAIGSLETREVAEAGIETPGLDRVTENGLPREASPRTFKHSTESKQTSKHLE